MTTYTLTLIDVRQVQPYLFNANELKQNLGASFLVEQATRAWIAEALVLEGMDHNWPNPAQDEFNPAKTIESGAVEVIYSGGGNAAILFPTPDNAKAFTRRYTGLVLQNAPGLEVAVGHVDVDWDSPDGMKTAWTKMREEVMPARKEGRAVAQPIFGLGVTSECAFTGKPAVGEIRDGERMLLVSADAQAKHGAAGAARDRIREILPVGPFYDYTDKFDDLGGERGKASYIAVIHADGNGTGKRFQTYLEGAKGNRDVVNKMRLFSGSVNQAGSRALETTRDWLLKTLDWGRNKEDRIYDQWRQDDYVRLQGNFVPFRPLVYGGDDITLVCEGRLGLAFAAKLLQAFAAQKLADDAPLYACAGVAIVHTHYPFARAYVLAEKLCQKAKHQARAWDAVHARVSLLHWYYASAGRTREEWQEIEAEEYTVPAGNLTFRPLVVAEAAGISTSSWRRWEVFIKQIEDFRRQPWAGRRNKVKDLRLALREGEAAVAEFARLHDPLPVIAPLAGQDVERKGWYDQRCLYFDALEADDLFIDPKEPGES